MPVESPDGSTQQVLFNTADLDDVDRTNRRGLPADLDESTRGRKTRSSPTTILTDQGRTANRPEPYIEYDGAKCEDPRTGEKSAIAKGLVSIVEAEGPIVARRAYDIYRRSCGIGRMDRELKRKMNSAMQFAIDQRLVDKEDELQIGGLLHCVMRAAGTPQIRFRERGPRSIDEIPPSELIVAAAIVEHTRRVTRASDDHCRAILDLYGLSRLTNNARDTINKCLKLKLPSVEEYFKSSD